MLHTQRDMYVEFDTIRFLLFRRYARYNYCPTGTDVLRAISTATLFEQCDKQSNRAPAQAASFERDQCQPPRTCSRGLRHSLQANGRR